MRMIPERVLARQLSLTRTTRCYKPAGKSIHLVPCRRSSLKNPQPNSANPNSQSSGIWPLYVAGATGAICAGLGAVYYLYPELFSGNKETGNIEPSVLSEKSDPLKVLDLSHKATDEVFKEMEAAIEDEFSKSKVSSENKRKKDKKHGQDELSRKLEKVEAKCEEFALREKKLSQALLELQEKVRSAENLSQEEFISLSDEIVTRTHELDACLSQGRKCKCKLDKVIKCCQDEDNSQLRECAENTRKKLTSKFSSLLNTSNSITFSETELNKANQAVHKLQLGDVDLWRDSTVAARDMSSDELTLAYKESQKKLNTLRCILINQFLNRHHTSSGSTQPLSLATSAEGESNTEEFEQKLRCEFEAELSRKLKDQKQVFETEMSSIVEAEREKVRQDLQTKMAEEVEELRKQYAQKFAVFAAKIQGIETAIDLKADSQRRALFSHYLWLASEAFRTQLQRDVRIVSERAEDLNKQLRPLHQWTRRVELVNSSENDTLIATVLSCIPEEAKSRGVYTEEMLKSRFRKVCRACHHWAKVSESRNSLYSHVLSYLQSLLRVTAPRVEVLPNELDLQTVDNYSLLEFAQTALERGDVSTCVKLLNNLEGKPAEVVCDWLKEAKLYLETKQAARVLSLLSTATGFTASPLS